jgi:BA14K-like protein
MSISVRMLAAATLLAAGTISLAGTATALPLASGLALENAAPAAVETVQWRRWRGVGPGFVAGALLGGALFGPRYYYGPGPYYYGPGPVVVPGPYVAPGPYPAEGDPVAYCMARFRSYDPASGTYLGYDGYRHPCP